VEGERWRCCSGKNLTVLARLAIRLIVLAIIIGIVAAIVPGIDVHGGFLWLVWIALIFSLVNLILAPLFHLISLPLIVLTLGLFLLVINAAMLAITAGLTKHLDVDSFGAALLGGLLISVFSWLAEMLLSIRPRDRRRARA
jgi:putative membrane protein